MPAHAFSETDRLMARPSDFSEEPQAVSARTCWNNWLRSDVTPHDGLIRKDHRLIQAILDRPQSATSLRRLLRNPLGFVWAYGLGWSEPENSPEPLTLEPLAFGNLVPSVLEQALDEIEKAGGLANADSYTVEAAVDSATKAVSLNWLGEFAVPPAIVWQQTVQEAQLKARLALAHRDETLRPAKSYGEVAFGGTSTKSGSPLPWDTELPVAIPDTGFTIRGYIDRLDLSGDGKHAHVWDYKTGGIPRER